MSGAGYALFESLALSSSGDEWTFLVVARIGTAVIHILTTALTGWALSQSWRDSRYLRLAAAYLTAVLIHGFWNGLTLISSYNSLLSLQPSPPEVSLITRIGAAAPLGLAILTLGALALLLRFNQLLFRAGNTGAKSPQGPGETPAPSPEQA